MTDSNQRYLELWVEVPVASEELWSVFCFEHGCLGIETVQENNRCQIQRVFFEHLSPDALQELSVQFQKLYPTLALITLIKVLDLPCENWKEAWHQFFKPVCVGEKLMICPPWHQSDVPSSRIPVVINPGQGFGTGNHPSTVLALELLEHHLLSTSPLPENLVDIGMGSGILAIAACQLGVQSALGVDIDEDAVPEVQENSALNGHGAKIKAVVGTPSVIHGQYSIVISNMLLHELLSVKNDFVRLLAKNGVLICSGFLDTQETSFYEELSALGFFPQYIAKNDEWRGAIFHIP
ncbi:50S ribosomal protein L11 methyltransferase [Deltaproteobacteria bacterium TL4]